VTQSTVFRIKKFGMQLALVRKIPVQK